MSDLGDHWRARVALLRRRLDEARSRGQVELHLALDDVELLVWSCEWLAKWTAGTKARKGVAR